MRLFGNDHVKELKKKALALLLEGQNVFKCSNKLSLIFHAFPEIPGLPCCNVLYSLCNEQAPRTKAQLD